MPDITDNEIASSTNTASRVKMRTAGAATINLRCALAGFDFAIRVDSTTGRILDASIRGAGPDDVSETLSDMCRAIQGHPIAEALRNGASTALFRHSVKAGVPEVEGVLLLRNAPPLFSEIDAALKSLLAEFEAGYGSRPPILSTAMQSWLEDSADGRRKKMAEFLQEHLSIRQRPAESVSLVDIENDVTGRPLRAICSFMAGCVSGDESLPRFIRRLEHQARQALGAPIEVLADEKEDKNKLRQLILVTKSGESRG